MVKVCRIWELFGCRASNVWLQLCSLVSFAALSERTNDAVLSLLESLEQHVAPLMISDMSNMRGQSERSNTNVGVERLLPDPISCPPMKGKSDGTSSTRDSIRTRNQKGENSYD